MDANQEYTQDTYQTGSTRPPKSHRGLVAFLLVLVIFLCGIITGLGLMNVRLFQKLTAAGVDAHLAVCQSGQETLPKSSQVLGFSPADIPELWQVYQDMPRGMFISDVETGSDAETKGILPGDILLQLDGVQITDTAALDQWLSTCGSTATVLLYRGGEQLTLTLRLNH